MRIAFICSIAGLLIACASTGTAKKGQEPAPVYLTQETAPTCSYKEVGVIQFTNTDTSEGDDLAVSIKRELGRRARRLGADAVVKAEWVTTVTVRVRGNRAPSTSDPQVGGAKRQVNGTAIKFDSPDCTY